MNNAHHNGRFPWPNISLFGSVYISGLAQYWPERPFTGIALRDCVCGDETERTFSPQQTVEMPEKVAN
jgi:hypothetical protein